MYTQMTGKLPVSPRWLMTGAVATTLLAVPAMAQVDKESKIAHIVVVKDGPGVQSKSIEVRVENGEISVKVDGEEVSVDRLGEVLESFGVVLDSDDFDFDFDFDLGFGFGPDDMRFAFAPDFEPKVILGIQMAPPGAALERHLRLEPGTTTMISGLYEGLPAQVAGLEEFDIIVAVDEPVRATRCHPDSSDGCKSDHSRCLTHDLWEELGHQIHLYLSSVSLADVCERRVLGSSGLRRDDVSAPPVSELAVAQ